MAIRSSTQLKCRNTSLSFPSRFAGIAGRFYHTPTIFPEARPRVTSRLLQCLLDVTIKNYNTTESFSRTLKKQGIPKRESKKVEAATGAPVNTKTDAPHCGARADGRTGNPTRASPSGGQENHSSGKPSHETLRYKRLALFV